MNSPALPDSASAPADPAAGPDPEPVAAPSPRPGGFLTSSGILLVGQAANFFAGLGRNIIVARIVTKDDFGTAAVFALFVTGLELVSDVGLDKQIVQSRHASDEKFQHVLQLAAVVRGVLLAAIVLLLAPTVASMIDTPDATWAFLVLAIIPFMRGFGHLDVVRFQREKRFLPWVVTMSAPQLVTLALAYPVAIQFPTYAAVLYLVIIQTVLTVLLGQLLSRRKYRIGWSGQYFGDILRFGWPLTLSGGLMLLVLQGDRLLVGAYFSTEVLAAFQAAFLLAIAPTTLVAGPIRSYILPVLSLEQDDDAEYARIYNLGVQLTASLALLSAVGLTAFSPALVVFLFGDSYRDAYPFIPWLALMWSIRLMRETPNTAAIGRGLTKIPLCTNVIRATALGASILVMKLGYPPHSVVIVAALGEAVALIVGMTLVRSQLRAGPHAASPAFWIPALGMTAVIIFSVTYDYEVTLTRGLIAFLAILIPAALIAPFTTHRTLAREGRSVLTRR